MKPQASGTGWTLHVELATESLLIAFEGRLSVSEARRSADACAAELSKRSLHLVWDLRLMKGYDVLAPMAWQRTLRPVIGNIRSVRMIGGNPFVRLGATALASALGIPTSPEPPAGGGSNDRRSS